MIGIVKAAYEHGECPDCGESISEDTLPGEECENCGHVFYTVDVCPECGYSEPSDGYGGTVCPDCGAIMEVEDGDN